MRQLKGIDSVSSYKKVRNTFHRFAESFFLVGFTILLLDFCWTIACGLRFGALYPNSLMQLAAAGARDLVGALFCYIFISQHLKKPSKYACMLFGVNLVFLALWFGLSPSPAYTDWTYALKKNYPSFVVAQSFFVSHIIGKTIVALFYFSWILKTSLFNSNR